MGTTNQIVNLIPKLVNLKFPVHARIHLYPCQWEDLRTTRRGAASGLAEQDDGRLGFERRPPRSISLATPTILVGPATT